MVRRRGEMEGGVRRRGRGEDEGGEGGAESGVGVV
jgi:hypothetical protein